MMSIQADKCPVCGGTRYIAMSYGGYRYKGCEMPLVECQACMLTYIIHGLTQSDFVDFYNDPRYFDSEYAGGVDMSYADNKAEMDEKASHILRIIRRYKSHGSFLDIGCAGGYLLEQAHTTGYAPVKGVEISDEMCRQGRARGLDIFQGSIIDVPSDFGHFDVIYMGDVLEHISDPRSFMRAIKAHLNPQALLVLELPLTYNLTLSGIMIGILNMFKGRLGRIYFLPAQHRHTFEDKPPYHVLMFGRRSIKNFLTQEGFVLKYLKIYEGRPKPKFRGTWYGKLKSMTHWLTLHLPQSYLGDRMIVIAEKL